MKTMGLLISHKNGERRRALLPEQVKTLAHPGQLCFEEGYGVSVGVPDQDYLDAGAHVVPRAQALQCDIIADVKLGDADYLDTLEDGKLLFGWAHAVQGVDFTTAVLEHGHTVVAWEEIYENGRYILYRNREVAGEAAIMHAFRYCGKMPYDTKVCIIGNGQTAKGALRILHGLGAEVDVYPRKMEKLFTLKMYEYDVIVNCVMWDTSRTDRIIYAGDLKRMKPGTMIIDVSCDPYLEIETSHPTTIDDPVYTVDGVIHYAVDNTPAMYPITVTKVLSEGLAPYVDMVLTMPVEDYPENLKKAAQIIDGHIVDQRISDFRRKRNLPCR